MKSEIVIILWEVFVEASSGDKVSGRVVGNAVLVF